MLLARLWEFFLKRKCVQGTFGASYAVTRCMAHANYASCNLFCSMSKVQWMFCSTRKGLSAPEYFESKSLSELF